MDSAITRVLAFESDGQPAARQQRILIVDDDPDVAALLAGAFGRYRIASEAAESGEDALKRIRERAPDLVILDLTMPGVDGYDVLRTVKSDPRLSRIPVIVLTANHEETALARSFGYGADDYVTKPFHAAEVAMRAYRLICPKR